MPVKTVPHVLSLIPNLSVIWIRDIAVWDTAMASSVQIKGRMFRPLDLDRFGASSLILYYRLDESAGHIYTNSALRYPL